jgi:hypothetical protein
MAAGADAQGDALGAGTILGASVLILSDYAVLMR